MVRVAVLGVTGYKALELLRFLLQHPEVEITALTDRQHELPVELLHPALAGCLDMVCENLEPKEVAARADVVFSALPPGLSSQFIPELLEAGCRVVDMSPDYRLSDPQVYEHWYGRSHGDPTRLGNVAYGLPELWEQRVREAELVATPGSFATAAVLGLVPLLLEQLVEPAGIVVDAKCGVSGAGRSPRMTTLFPECNESVSPFSVARHPQIPEIEKVLSGVVGRAVEVLLTPHQVPMDRGILCTAYARLVRPVDEEELLESLRRFYSGKPFVRVVEHLPSTKDTAGTNFCDLTVRTYRNQAIVISCLDNLGKGGAGAAVQNFNLMLGLAETLGLLPRPFGRKTDQPAGSAPTNADDSGRPPSDEPSEEPPGGGR